MEDGAADSLGVDEGCEEGNSLGSNDSDGLELGARLNDGTFEGESLGCYNERWVETT
jgi:hypothetical protein